MIIQFKNIIATLDEGPEAAVHRVGERIGSALASVERIALSKVSVDARHGKIQFICSVEAEVPDELGRGLLKREELGAVRKEVPNFQIRPGEEKLPARPVVVGFGPAGMFSALLLAQYGYRPIVLERGEDVETRIEKVERFWKTGEFDPESNVQFGEGGAGTFSDGKLTTRIGDPRCARVLAELVRFGAPPEVLVRAKPHVGTDRLRGVVKALREEIIRLGGEVRFGTAAEGFRFQNGRILAVRAAGEEVEAGVVVLAVGHSARDTFEAADRSGLVLEAKAFSAGVRIEHRQAAIDAALYGRHAGHPNLPPGEYQLSLREGDRAAYTFCMCPGGTVVAAASAPGQVVTNGMSNYLRDGENANAALCVSVGPKDFGPAWRDGVRFQLSLELRAFALGGGGYRAPAMRLGDFLKGAPPSEPVAPTYPLGVNECDMKKLLPPAAVEMMRRALPAFGRKLRGFDGAGAILTGVETRTSSPVRILRGESLEAVGTQGLYPTGEGAGYAGGIMSAAVDGLRVAERIIERYRAPGGGRRA